MANLISISIEAFKELEGTDIVDIIQNPKEGGKLFASCGNGSTFKSQGNLDTEKPVKFLYDTEEDDHSDGCFVNPNTDNVVASL